MNACIQIFDKHRINALSDFRQTLNECIFRFQINIELIHFQILNSILVVVLLGGFLCCTNVQGLPWMQFLPFIFASHIQFEGYGSVDTRGGAGVGIRVAFRLKRHAMSLVRIFTAIHSEMFYFSTQSL